MLSNETATGKYPVKAVQVMAKVARTADKTYKEFCRLGDLTENIDVENTSDATAVAAATLARSYSKVKALVCLTYSGATAIAISQNRPTQPIIALTPSTAAYNRLALAWGVIPVLLNTEERSYELFNKIESEASRVVESLGIGKKGDVIALVVGAQKLTNISKSMRVVILK
jgi:pyruvate kinase